MSPTGYFIDSGLLALLVVGSVGGELIDKHRRLKKFTIKDYETLRNLVDQTVQIYVTPHTLTEASNLLGQHGEPERSQFFERLRIIIEESKEVIIASSTASQNAEFIRLGLTDAMLLETVTADIPLVTVDLDLYLAALAKGENAAVNFTYLQQL